MEKITFKIKSSEVLRGASLLFEGDSVKHILLNVIRL